MKNAPTRCLVVVVLSWALVPGASIESGCAGQRDAPFVEAPNSPIHVGPMAGQPVIADVNGDGKPDVVVACGTCCGSQPSPESGHVVVLLNRGGGRLERAAGPRNVVGPSVRALAVGDVNKDGKPDVVAAEHDTYEVTVLLGAGAGALTKAPGSPFTAGSGRRAHTHAIALADMNADGNADILTTNANDNAISVLIGDGKAGFTPAQGSPFPTGRRPYDAIATCDANADGSLDVIVPLLVGNKIGLLLGDGRGRLTSAPEHRFAVESRPGHLAVADLNGDRHPDIVATHDDVGIVDVLLGDGKAGVAAATGSPYRLPTAVWGTAIGDLDQDGKLDVLLGAAMGKDLVCLLGDGEGRFREASTWKLKAGNQPNYVAVGDLDGDHRLDIVTGNYADGTVTVLLNSAR